jgi:hypothetical protein
MTPGSPTVLIRVNAAGPAVAAPLAPRPEPAYAERMNQSKTALERAFEMARSGQYATLSDLSRALSREGYSATQLEGGTLRRQLGALIKASKPVDADQA